MLEESMDIVREGSTIIMKGKEPDNLDLLVLDFIRLIPFDYVIISGYAAILFGRTRTTEDVDLFVNPQSEEEFSRFCSALSSTDFSFLNAENCHDAYDLLKEGLSLRVVYKGELYPNFELKLPKSKTAKISLENKMKVVLDQGTLNIGPLELQIPFKLYLGSEKDFADARHLYKVFKDKLDTDEFKYFLKEMDIDKKTIKKALGEEIEI
jgi:hypothetical protein